MKQLPNLLSAARLALAPYLFLLLWRREYGAALVVMLIAAITDFLDGYLARLLGGSRLGAYLDPLADKVLLSGAFLTLALDGAMERWLAIVVLGRDVGILLFAAGTFLFLRALRDFPPSILGKVSTAVQIAFILALVGHLAGFPIEWAADILKWMTAVVTIGSALDYLWRGARMIRG